MGRLSTLTVILIIGAWGVTTEGASPDDAVSSPAAAGRKPAPVPPIRYLEAGSRLFNSGNFELAAKYLEAAQMYRDQLQQGEQTTLDAYLKELSKVRAAIASGLTATDGAGPATTGCTGDDRGCTAMTAAAPATTAAAPATTAADRRRPRLHRRRPRLPASGCTGDDPGRRDRGCTGDDRGCTGDDRGCTGDDRLHRRRPRLHRRRPRLHRRRPRLHRR